MARVVVVGGGFGGMSAAARLAKLGHKVTLLESTTRLGGALGFVERDGFRWDAGPAVTALPAVLRDLFRKSGRPLERELDLVPVASARQHRFLDGAVLSLPAGSRAEQVEAVGSTLGTRAGREWIAHVDSLAPTWDLLRRGVLERPWSAEHAEPATRALVRRRTSLRRAVHASLADPRLRQVALAPSLVDGQDAADAPAWAAVWAYVEQNFGVWTASGGMGALTDALTRRLATRRVDVALETPATDLVVRGGRAVAVSTAAGELDADVVVCAVDPRSLPALARTVRRVEAALPPPVVHVGLAEELPDLPAEVVLHGDPTLVLRTTGTAPPGCAAWTVLGRGRVSPDLLDDLAARGLDVRDQVEVRVDRSAWEQVAETGGSSSYGVRWRGRTTTDRLLAGLPAAGVFATGAHAAVAADLPAVGLASALVAERVGPAQ